MLKCKKPANTGFCRLSLKKLNLNNWFWRRERDSNPRKLALQRFSRPPHSTALPSLRGKYMFASGFCKKVIYVFTVMRTCQSAPATWPMRSKSRQDLFPFVTDQESTHSGLFSAFLPTALNSSRSPCSARLKPSRSNTFLPYPGKAWKLPVCTHLEKKLYQTLNCRTTGSRPPWRWKKRKNFHRPSGSTKSSSGNNRWCPMPMTGCRSFTANKNLIKKNGRC